MDLNQLGWNSHFEQLFENYKNTDFKPARILKEHKEKYIVVSEFGELDAEVTGKFRFDALQLSDFPAVGDWVAITPILSENKALIQALLPRKSYFSRKVAGNLTEEQVVASNIDTIFIVAGLDKDFNLRRIERYITLAYDSGADPVIVLNKSDLCDRCDEIIEEVSQIAVGLPVLNMSALEQKGTAALMDHIKPGKTAAFLGSSGVGKSTLINSVLGYEHQDTGSIRIDDSRGRHTTTHREMIIFEGGGILIDTPGMREIQLWSESDGLNKAFTDIDTLGSECRFSDCTHNNEPGCAVLEAIETGELDANRFKSYLKLQRELKHLARRQGDRDAIDEHKQRWKKVTQFQRFRKKNNL